MGHGKSILTRTAQAGFREFAARLADALLPSSCLLCGSPCCGAPLCPGCLADLPPLAARHCPLCLEATTHGERCGACLARPPHFDQVHALYRYAFPLDHLISDLKYHARFALAKHWGRQLAGLTPPPDRIIPLPLHPTRLAERGYNQAQEIARHLARSLERPLDPDSLEKSRATRPQAELSHKERQGNLKGAFACTRDMGGLHLLLVDDVLTTGATLDEAARVLKLHGAARVEVAVVARTPRH